jgi:hypothetical protein
MESSCSPILPPLAAVIPSSNFTGSIYVSAYADPIYTTVTDDRIETPAPEKDKVTQS